METNSDRESISVHRIKNLYDALDKAHQTASNQIQDLRQQLAEKDKTIAEMSIMSVQLRASELAELQKQLDLEIRVANAQVEIVKEKDKEIASLKEALTRIKNHATLPVEVEKEIETLLK